MTFTRIYMGEPKLKGIPRKPPCVDPEAEVTTWVDESFENIAERFGTNGTPSGNGLPSYSSLASEGPYYWDDPFNGDSPLPGSFSAFSDLQGGSNYRFSSANPHSGTGNLRISGTTAGGIVLGSEIHFASHIPCVSFDQAPGTLQPFHTRPVTARTQGGELISYSAWLYHGTGGTPAWRWLTTGFDVNDTVANYAQLWSNTQSFQSMSSGSWVNVTHSFTAPSGDAWVTTSLVQRLTLGAGVTYSFDLDDVTVTTS